MTEKIIPDGYKLVAVKGLDELVYWLERCKDKGHLENCADLIEPFEAFEYRNISEEAVIAAHEAKAAPAALRGFATLNEWFLSLPEQRQAQLRDDKWMLAGAAFEAGQASPAVPQGEPVAWFEYNESLDAWFLAYSRNPNAKTRPLVFGDVSATPTAPSQPAVPVVDDLHDYPVCAVFRHGSCTCDAASNQRFEWCLKHIPGHLSDGIFDVLGCSTASENQIKKAIDSAIHAHTPANSEHQAIYTRISDGYMQDVFKSDGLAVEQDDEDDEPVPTVGTDAVIHAWNMLPGELQRNPHLQKLFEALKTCRDVAADPATPAAPSQPAATCPEACKSPEKCCNFGCQREPSQPVTLTDTRPEFESYFLGSRKSKGANRKPTLERFEDGTYKDDHTQRHWWTWQQAIAALREKEQAT